MAIARQLSVLAGVLAGVRRPRNSKQCSLHWRRLSRGLVAKQARLLQYRLCLARCAATRDDVVAAGYQGLRGGEVASSPGCRMAGKAENRAPGRADQNAPEDQAQPGGASREQPDEKPDEQTEPRATRRSGCGRARPRKPTGYPLHRAQTGTNDLDVLDRETLVREPVYRLLRLFIRAIAGYRVPRHGRRVKTRRAGISHHALLHRAVSVGLPQTRVSKPSRQVHATAVLRISYA